MLNPGEISKDGFVLLAAIKTTSSAVSVKGQRLDELAFSVEAGEQITFTNTYAPFGCGVYVNSFDEEKHIVYAAGTYTFTIQNSGTLYLYVSEANTADIVNLSVESRKMTLPYYNYRINESDHYLQNAYVAFCFLQQYYAFDMPAPLYSINGEQEQAQGIKKLKNQTLRFPVLNDPDMVQLVKTNLGNGTIEKLSVNLSSRNANATLKYDTE